MTAIKSSKRIVIKTIEHLLRKGICKWVPDKKYLGWKYKQVYGKEINWDNPESFNEKLQWLKLNDRNPKYTQLVDKYEVRKYISDEIGNEYLIPLLGVWDSVEEIEWDKLPSQFVLKSTHDSGGVVVCKDKSQFDIRDAKRKLKRSLSRNYYYIGREWPYKNIQPKIICEKYLVDESDSGVNDYKFYCFHGEPKVLFIASEREKTIKYDFYDLQFNHLPIGKRNSNKKISKPSNFENMVELAKTLSMGMKHVRIDFYNIKGKIYFGEFTFYSGSGFDKFDPNHEKYDKLLGSWIDIK